MLASSFARVALRPAFRAGLRLPLRTGACAVTRAFALPKVVPTRTEPKRFYSEEEAEEEEDTASYGGIAAINRPAPDFLAQAVVNEHFKEISLADYKGKWVVLFFYPLDFTFVCPTEIVAFSERAQEFKELGVELLACSVDSKFSHLAWTKTPRKQGGLGKINFPLISDISKSISSSYGVLNDEGVAYRGLFIIDPEGLTRQITINDLPIGRSVDETLRLLKAFQHHEKHGEVCPANWTPGKDTMKADPEGAKTYWQKNY